MQGRITRGTRIREPQDLDFKCNTLEGFIMRSSSRCLEASAHITANNESKIINIFKYTGVVRIQEQWAFLTDDTALTNATNIYATTYDGTNIVDLTADGINLSGAPVGSFFVKDKVAAQPYSAAMADQNRMIETLDNKKIGRPFTLVGKGGVDNFIQFRITTNTVLDMTMFVHFEYELLDGSTLEFV